MDYTTDGDGYCQIFDRSRGDAFLASAVWCGASIGNLLRAVQAVPSGLGGIVLVWMGNDYEDWVKSEENRQRIRQGFQQFVATAASKASQVVLELFG